MHRLIGTRLMAMMFLWGVRDEAHSDAVRVAAH
jgi:hypothetical protein